jgi:hypothetical protein
VLAMLTASSQEDRGSQGVQCLLALRSRRGPIGRTLHSTSPRKRLHFQRALTDCVLRLSAMFKSRMSLRPLTQVRYSSRLPERPPYRAPDPLVNNPHAHYEALPNDLTFIHRPPPSAAPPESFTTLPSSPLLKPVSPSASSSTSGLPPALRKASQVEKWMSDEEIKEMQRLRKEDPEKWTAGKLAKKFGCTQVFVRLMARLPKPERKKALAKRDAEHEAFRAKWGEKRLLQKDIRQKRKDFW